MHRRSGCRTVPNGKSYILFCAGEDSGDVIGVALVRTLVTDSCFGALGAGGARMQNAGMRSVVDFENLPVSGFGDVLPRYFKLRQSYHKLKSILESPDCLGLVAIDYPGFNMKLTKLAGELRKPTLYVAPPQVWAWKQKRTLELANNPYVKLAVFFDFEEKAYRSAGCDVVRIRHPFINSSLQGNAAPATVTSPCCLLLPGSRKSQALRNLPLYLKSLQLARKSMVISRMDVVLLAARQELVNVFEKVLRQFGDEELLRKIRVDVAPQNADDRALLYRSAKLALTAPGTATLELALSGCPMVVCTKPDILTYGLASRYVKTKYFALPNIIQDKLVYPEIIVAPGGEHLAVANVAEQIATMCISKQESDTETLYSKLLVGKPLESLMSEFLRQFV